MYYYYISGIMYYTEYELIRRICTKIVFRTFRESVCEVGVLLFPAVFFFSHQSQRTVAHDGVSEC
jgi:hypothetical protein